MTAYRQRQHLKYTTPQLFDLVADVERFPEFMPGVIDAHVQHRKDHTIRAAFGDRAVATMAAYKRRAYQLYGGHS
jgi:ribosome-associated toxin RatA of RatAB toxin-antitoxin module